MDVKVFRTFLELARVRHFGRAAGERRSQSRRSRPRPHQLLADGKRPREQRRLCRSHGGAALPASAAQRRHHVPFLSDRAGKERGRPL